MVFVFLVVLLEAAVTADVFLNRNWEEVSFLSRCTIFFTLLELLHYKFFFFLEVKCIDPKRTTYKE